MPVGARWGGRVGGWVRSPAPSRLQERGQMGGIISASSSYVHADRMKDTGSCFTCDAHLLLQGGCWRTGGQVRLSQAVQKHLSENES